MQTVINQYTHVPSGGGEKAIYTIILWIQKSYRSPKYNIRVRYTAKLGI